MAMSFLGQGYREKNRWKRPEVVLVTLPSRACNPVIIRKIGLSSEVTAEGLVKLQQTFIRE